MKKVTLVLMTVILCSVSFSGCFEQTNDEGPIIDDEGTDQYPDDTRYEKLPTDIEKRTPEGDTHPPVLHSDLFGEPVPMDGPVNTAGAEDSPFILPDGKTFYFFFTPDVRVQPEKQLLDNVTGIWCSHLEAGVWSEPERVWLQDAGKLALDGAHWIDPDNEEIWFGSAREGYNGVNYFKASKEGNTWSGREYTGDLLNVEYEMGEIHMVGDTIYFHSPRSGGKGGSDLWTTTLVDGEWGQPVNIGPVNTEADESLPWVSETENEMFFTRTYMGTPGIFRSTKENGKWSEPELMVSQFAGEPTLDREGNLYFVHHYFEEGEMIEADIYYCSRN